MELARLEEERAAEQAANKLEPHQQRVVEEKAQNDERLSKLNDFIENNPVFLSKVLIDAERLRLIRQRDLMTQLSQVLGERIAAFDPDVRQKEALDQITAEAQATGEYE